MRRFAAAGTHGGIHAGTRGGIDARIVAGLVAGIVWLPGCGIPTPHIGVAPYRIEIQQGNFISQETVAQLKVGMSTEQVRFVLGSPLVTDMFHGERWDYVYYRAFADGRREQRKMAVFFQEGKLVRVSGDVAPAGQAAVPAEKTSERNITEGRPREGKP